MGCGWISEGIAGGSQLILLSFFCLKKETIAGIKLKKAHKREKRVLL